jgi:uncharacterized protein YegL
MQVRLNRTFIVVSIMTILAGCGNDSGFTGDNGKRNSSDAQKTVEKPKAPVVDDSFEPYTALNWFWQCDTNPVPKPADKPSEHVVEGTGPHSIDAGRLKGTTVIFSGHLCEPQRRMRDIVFVVDVSGSMNGNDPRVGNSCGRLQAIESVMASVSAGNANFAIVTFGSGVTRTSSKLFDNQAGLYADVAGTRGIADVLCDAGGGTNYDAGLTRAAELLQFSREKAGKEVYFVSDGEPNGGQDGIAIATSMKNTGVAINGALHPVTIATVMMAGQDKVLEKFIASIDSDGKPMHAFVAQTAELAKVLTGLSDNEIVGAELRYRPIGTTEYTFMDLLDHLQGFDFILPSININLEDGSEGLEVVYEYFDKHDNRYTTGGKLLWTQVSTEKVVKP